MEAPVRDSGRHSLAKKRAEMPACAWSPAEARPAPCSGSLSLLEAPVNHSGRLSKADA